jgi:hypothetical protein
VVLLYTGINFAADVGDILFAAPLLLLGGLQLLYAVTGHYPRRSPFARRRGAPPNVR